MRRTTWMAALFCVCWLFQESLPAQADEALSGVGVPVYIDFSDFAGEGFASSPAAGQLDSDSWIVTGLDEGDVSWGGTATTGDFALGLDDGGVGMNGVYAFDVGGGNITLGVQPGADDWTPGTLVLRVQNDSGSTLQSVVVSYTLWINNDT